VRGDSYFRFDCPEKAVARLTLSVTVEHGTPNQVVMEGKYRSLIIDTGSNISILQPGNWRSDIRDTAMKPFGVTGETSM
jgi:hypothetical protein